MDLQFTSEEEAFRLKVRSWLAENMPTSGLSDTREGREDKTWLTRAKAWQRRLYEAGYVALAWPKEYGGQAMDPVRQSIVNDEMVRAKAPYKVGASGLGMLGPTLISWGTEEQKQRYLPKILTAEEIWCQGYSEPGAGSDLASLKTRAELVGDEFVVNGQKVWTSGAQYADMDVLPGAHRSRGAQASRHLLHPHRHEHARHHRAPAGADDRRRGLQRGVLRQRPRAAQKPGRQAQRRLDGRQRDALPRAQHARLRQRQRAALQPTAGAREDDHARRQTAHRRSGLPPAAGRARDPRRGDALSFAAPAHRSDSRQEPRASRR